MNKKTELKEIELNDFLNKQFSELKAEAFKLGYKVRLASVNGIGLVGTRDARADRINVSIQVPEDKLEYKVYTYGDKEFKQLDPNSVADGIIVKLTIG